MPFWGLTRVRPGNHVSDRVQIPQRGGTNFGVVRFIEKHGGLVSGASCGKMGEPIEMPLWRLILVVQGTVYVAKIGQIDPQWVTSRRCDLLPNYF